MKEYTIHQLESIDSTNEEARRRVEAALSPQEVDDTVIIAETQLKGRGRLGRRWYSPPGNLYMTIIKRPQVPLAELSKISLVVGVAIHRVLKGIFEKSVLKNGSELYLALKWPNDILVNRMKLGGILVETDSYPIMQGAGDTLESCDSQNTFCFIGIGMNLLSSPELTAYPACSFLDLIDQIPPKEELVSGICRELDDLLEVWSQGGFNKIREEWLWAAYGLGKPVCARAENGFQVYGRFVTISEDGVVIVTDDLGNDHLIRSSEITYLT